MRHGTALVAALLVVGLLSTVPYDEPEPAARTTQTATRTTQAAPASTITTEAQLRAAWADPRRRRIDLGADIALRNCAIGDPIRESPYSIVVDGHGHVVRQTCFEKRLLRQDGTGFLELRDVTLMRGGSAGPGAAGTSRGEIAIYDSVITPNPSAEPVGGVLS